MRRPSCALVGLVVAVALSACSDDPEAGRSTTSTTRGGEASTTSTTDVDTRPDDADAVLHAYEQSWVHYDDFLNGEATGDPGEYFDGELLATLTDRIVEYADRGLELRGEAQLSPSDVSIDGSVARLTDCQLDGTYAVVRDTGEVVVPAGTRPQVVDVRLVHADGRWKVSSASYGPEGSCVR